MNIIVRQACVSDADAMAALLNDIIARGGTTAYRDAFNAQRIIATFISPQHRICCNCASEADQILGFQALEWADPVWPGPYPLPADWAVIATYVVPTRHRGGIGQKLFAATLAAARASGVCQIDATIRLENLGGRSYYSRLGFVDYRCSEETVSKRFSVS